MTEHEVPPVVQGFVPIRLAVRPALATLVKVTASVAPKVGYPAPAVAVILAVLAVPGNSGPKLKGFAETVTEGGGEESSKVAACAVSETGEVCPLEIVTHRPLTLVPVQSRDR